MERAIPQPEPNYDEVQIARKELMARREANTGTLDELYDQYEDVSQRIQTYELHNRAIHHALTCYEDHMPDSVPTMPRPDKRIPRDFGEGRPMVDNPQA